MFTNTQFDEHLIGMGHGGTLNKVRNPVALKERAAATMLLKISPPETMRTALLSTLVLSATYNYTLPADFKSLIDLYLTDDRSILGVTPSLKAQRFDLKKLVASRQLSFEGSGGAKIMRLVKPDDETDAETTMKYYSKYFFMSAALAFESRPSDSGFVLCDNDTLPIFAHECLIQMAHQMEGTDSEFDITFAKTELKDLYPAYTALYPEQSIKPQKRYSAPPRFRW